MRPPSLALPFLSLVVAGCGTDGPQVREITESRILEAADHPVAWNAAPMIRFSLRPTAAPSTRPSEGGAHWTTPEGWSELPTSSLRQANFLVAGDERAECYLTVLNGTGGGLDANVNRWRRQMALESLSGEEVAALPRVVFLGGEAVLVELEGTWTGMSGDEDAAGYSLIGLVQVAEGSARFLKLTGPRDLVDGQRAAFLALADSLHLDDGSHSHGGEPAQSPASSGAALAWTAPESWERGPEKMMREVTFFAGPDGVAECYVSILGGTGGGMKPNIDRWCDQMGSALLSSQEVVDLPRITVLDTQAVLVEVSGRYTGMGDADVPDAVLFGVVCTLPARSVYVKMIGPRDVMESEREAFLEFSRSLELTR